MNQSRFEVEAPGVEESTRQKWINLFGPTDQFPTYADSIDPSETARYDPSHQDLYCLPSLLEF